MQPRRPGRRAWASILGLVAAGSLMASLAAPVGAQSPSAAAATQGGTLVVGITSDADQLNPWLATQFQAVAVLGLVYGTLTELDQDLNVVPGIAESWESSADGTTLTFHLRDGVTFQDGTPLTSADVKASLDGIMAKDSKAVAATTLASVTAVTAPDPQTVVLTLSAPDAGILAGLASVNLAILPAGATPDAISTTPNGTGPFAFSGRKPNESISLVANPHYWGAAPKLAGIEFRIIPDETSIVSGLQSGNVQFAVLDDPLVAQSAAGDGITIVKTPQLSYHVLQLNAARAAPGRPERPTGHLLRHRPTAGPRHRGSR